MEIRTANNSDINSLYEFNTKSFPEKVINSKKYIDFWLSKSFDAINNITLLLDDQNKIVGQTIMSSMAYYYQQEKIKSVWGFDLIVNEKYRKESWGLDLMLFNGKINPKGWATGSGSLALAINLKLGMKLVGQIKKYVGIINPFWIFTAIGKKPISRKKFPIIINFSNIAFHLIDKDKIPILTNPFNSNLLEIVRDSDFLKWRYFNDLHQYAFYKDFDSNIYFVLRTTVFHHIKVLLLVDYRCDSQKKEQFETILFAAKKIASKLHLPILITGSYLKTFDEILENDHFISIGRPRPILGHIKCKDRKEDIDNRNFVFVTLADSDGETNWI